MEYISTYARTREIIEKNEFHIKKGFGQNFLVDQHVVNKIIDGSGIGENDYVIEIGPGIGGLTERLAIKAKQVTAVEIDKTLIPILEENLSPYENIDIINEDILKVDLSKLIAEHGYENAKIVANLPYYITTPIIMGILESSCPVKSMTVMIQKEVAARIRASAGSKDYGALSLAVQYRADASLIANVPRNSFIPRPNVDSAVIRIETLEKPRVAVNDEKLMFGIIRASFEQRRKTIVNCLFNIMNLGLTKDELAEVLAECGLDVNARGESLDLEAFAALTAGIEKRIIK
ncbi:16S rRNA (adenine(1518)-N(6)/adenine(1519)-N(6))-dimethyltransferase RsmA [Tyzzerella sp. OttesenSCG-928-J15]|nr:16S rRNA (adenine(1518)-N(6)/adenine(1519)-N(6))-dimethyltransferase RsmA [Tyzzerella sp. OttesenSCG-928-J15]